MLAGRTGEMHALLDAVTHPPAVALVEGEAGIGGQLEPGRLLHQPRQGAGRHHAGRHDPQRQPGELLHLRRLPGPVRPRQRHHLPRNGGGSHNLSGTSMATPHTAGAAALYLSSNPGATPQQVRDAIVAAADSGQVSNPGAGSPNLLLNVAALGGEPGPDPYPQPEPGESTAAFTA